jgi:hypothetical protein
LLVVEVVERTIQVQLVALEEDLGDLMLVAQMDRHQDRIFKHHPVLLQLGVVEEDQEELMV